MPASPGGAARRLRAEPRARSPRRAHPQGNYKPGFRAHLYAQGLCASRPRRWPRTRCPAPVSAESTSSSTRWSASGRGEDDYSALATVVFERAGLDVVSATCYVQRATCDCDGPPGEFRTIIRRAAPATSPPDHPCPARPGDDGSPRALLGTSDLVVVAAAAGSDRPSEHRAGPCRVGRGGSGGRPYGCGAARVGGARPEDDPDAARFAAVAAHMLPLHRGWQAIRLMDSSLRVLVDTAVVAGEPSPVLIRAGCSRSCRPASLPYRPSSRIPRAASGWCRSGLRSSAAVRSSTCSACGCSRRTSATSSIGRGLRQAASSLCSIPIRGSSPGL